MGKGISANWVQELKNISNVAKSRRALKNLALSLQVHILTNEEYLKDCIKIE